MRPVSPLSAGRIVAISKSAVNTTVTTHRRIAVGRRRPSDSQVQSLVRRSFCVAVKVERMLASLKARLWTSEESQGSGWALI